MEYRPLTIALFFSTAAAAGTVHFETDASASVTHNGVTIARATGPGMLTLGDFPTGSTQLQVAQNNRDPVHFELTVPRNQDVTVRLQKNTLTASNGVLKVQDLPAPSLAFRTEPGETFTIVIDGTATHTLTEQLVVNSLTPGRHRVDVRSADKLIVWARGTVDLMAGEAVVLSVHEGRMVVADGLNTAWTPIAGDAR
jgi:hypothetical protein